MPVYYTPEQKEELCAEMIRRLANGETLVSICRDERMPHRNAIYQWCDADPVLASHFARARDDGYDAIAADALEIADNEDLDPNSRRVRVETRLKLLAKWDSKRYGDKLTVDQTLTVKESPLAQVRALEMRRAAGRVLVNEETPAGAIGHTITVALPITDEDLF